MEIIWTTGIRVKHCEEGWTAQCNWQSGKFAQYGYMEGEITTRYQEPTLEQAIDHVLECMKVINVKRTDEIDIMKDNLGFSLYFNEDEDQTDVDLQLMKDEAIKRNWKFYD